jgi:AcrR family transcriptional regulator
MRGNSRCYRACVRTDRSRPLRADAARNAERLVRAAAEVFAESGVEVPLDEIARRAGVGVATLYRHFASKDDLARAVIEQAYAEEVAPVLDRALRADDARQGLVDALEAAMRTMVRCRNAVAAGKRPQSTVFDLITSYLDVLATLLARAQQQGTIRADLRSDDLPYLVWMLVSTVRHDGTARRWPRYLTLLLDALTPDNTTDLPLGEACSHSGESRS